MECVNLIFRLAICKLIDVCPGGPNEKLVPVNFLPVSLPLLRAFFAENLYVYVIACLFNLRNLRDDYRGLVFDVCRAETKVDFKTLRNHGCTFPFLTI